MDDAIGGDTELLKCGLGLNGDVFTFIDEIELF